jgi:hypothetical protein
MVNHRLAPKLEKFSSFLLKMKPRTCLIFFLFFKTLSSMRSIGLEQWFSNCGLRTTGGLWLGPKRSTKFSKFSMENL